MINSLIPPLRHHSTLFVCRKMADRSRDSGNSNNSKRSRQNVSDDEEQAEDNDEASSPPDIGLGSSSQHVLSHNAARECLHGAGCSSENTRRDDNPFSFKHFLSGNLVGCSRPKVYAPSPPTSPSPRLHEVTSGLPDFVQDHLVVEQCYLNSISQQPMAVDLDNLPHFAAHDNYEVGYSRAVGGAEAALPDFLSDGPIRSERRDSDSPPSSPSAVDHRHSPRFQVENERLRLENDRLRRELDAMRRQLSDQITRSETLEAELSVARSRDQTGTEALERIIEQTEDNLKRATKRALNAENRAEKLKHEVQSLKNELEAMRCREGTASTSALQTDNERLASQLRNAANTAELSLRHLLIGVDNLRLLAASLESSSRTHRRAESSEESLDEDNPSGPAL